MNTIIYIESGINWVFPYQRIEEDDKSITLRELPRQHKTEFDFSVVVRHITVCESRGVAYIGPATKKLTIQR